MLPCLVGELGGWEVSGHGEGRINSGELMDQHYSPTPGTCSLQRSTSSPSQKMGRAQAHELSPDQSAAVTDGWGHGQDSDTHTDAKPFSPTSRG